MVRGKKNYLNIRKITHYAISSLNVTRAKIHIIYREGFLGTPCISYDFETIKSFILETFPLPPSRGPSNQ